jgi:NAD(P)-dependent dehydrogenase (short-subunit alcohol dehydrogenase family)
MALTSSIAIITGASRGIGRGIALELARQGYSLGIHYRSDHQSAQATAEDARNLGAPEVACFQADLADLAEGTRLVQEVRDRFNTARLWVNNAGIAPLERRDVLTVKVEGWDRVLGTNLRGPFFLTQQVARWFVERVEGGGLVPPQIHFITSVSAELASLNRGEYCVSKAGLSMVARLFALRLAQWQIPVFEIRPGIIATDMTAGVQSVYAKRILDGLVPMGRIGEPGDVGKVVVALAEGQFPYATGTVLTLDGGLGLPRL